jgi:hypothetical protein
VLFRSVTALTALKEWQDDESGPNGNGQH